ncbi:helix-turn-helix transcriptional regulator [Streptomyces sp. PSKA54]|uniref:Helix-turn-helix transcriptional regulator n=1 Tax=Streptomyces himalayensis subsp. aureolus TaxID=2758039 RepID=A0A7W2D3V3_9ACTN|nr:helix-turn-helix transcriptional regulator [Streptomyces himalayensis]MBA4864112.1 helix-turn-helix transcriptional regulator [Streptomyces himalayensis subsp. aureolus]
MKGFTRWADMRGPIIERIGEEEFEAGKEELQARARGHRLAEIRRRQGMTQAQLAELMGVTKSRVSQIERGQASTHEVLARYVAALGGQLHLVADFGEEQLKVG